MTYLGPLQWPTSPKWHIFAHLLDCSIVPPCTDWGSAVIGLSPHEAETWNSLAHALTEFRIGKRILVDDLRSFRRRRSKHHYWVLLPVTGVWSELMEQVWDVIRLKKISHLAWITPKFNTLRPTQNGQHFADDIFKRIYFNENVWIAIKISLKVVHKDPINNIPALVQIMDWRCPADKPLSEPMVISFPTHICITQPQWQGLKLTLISRSNFLLLLSKSWSKSDRHRSYFLSLKADIWLDWVANFCS